jgi:hypothetical protein
LPSVWKRTWLISPSHCTRATLPSSDTTVSFIMVKGHPQGAGRRKPFRKRGHAPGRNAGGLTDRGMLTGAGTGGKEILNPFVGHVSNVPLLQGTFPTCPTREITKSFS